MCFFYQYGSLCQPDQGHLREKIIIKNCGDFYSYFLTETSYSWVARYCGMEKEHIDGSCTISTTTTSFTTPTTTMSSKCTYKGDGYCDDINNNADCEFDGGDCCLDPVKTTYCTECICHAPAYPETGKNFQELLTECLEKRPNIDLNDLMKKLQESVDQDDVIDVYVYETSYAIWYSENLLEEKLEKIFNPQHGYCQTFNPSKIKSIQIDGAMGNLVFNFTGHAFMMFFHEEKKLPESGIRLQDKEAYHISLTKRIVSQTNLARLPCSENHVLTCQDTVLHTYLLDRFSCKAPILKSGLHLERIFNETLPDCSSTELIEVIVISLHISIAR